MYLSKDGDSAARRTDFKGDQFSFFHFFQFIIQVLVHVKELEVTKSQSSHQQKLLSRTDNSSTEMRRQ